MTPPGFRPFYDGLIAVNPSVWTSMTALWEFVYRGAHLDTMRRRREWFHWMVEPLQVRWWVPAGHIPTLAEGVERLERLRATVPGPKPSRSGNHTRRGEVASRETMPV